jgi:hypothetical protein
MQVRSGRATIRFEGSEYDGESKNTSDITLITMRLQNHSLSFQFGGDDFFSPCLRSKSLSRGRFRIAVSMSQAGQKAVLRGGGYGENAALARLAVQSAQQQQQQAQH